MAMVVALPRKRWNIPWPSHALRWLPFLARRHATWTLRFPVALLVGHQVVGHFWTAQDGPFYSLSLSLVIIVGDSLLCQAMSLVDLAEIWQVKDGQRPPMPAWLVSDRLRFRFIGAAIGAVVGYYLFKVRALPNLSLTLHHYEWTYDVYHVWIAGLVVRKLLMLGRRIRWLARSGQLERRYVWLTSLVALCVAGYLVIFAAQPEPIHIITGWRINMGPFAEHVQPELFTWGPKLQPGP